MARPKKSATPKRVETITHTDAGRLNIPTAEYQAVLTNEQKQVLPVRYTRDPGALHEEKESRDRDLDPQLVWRGKDEQDWTDLVVHAPPLYIQEKVHPKVLLDDLKQMTQDQEEGGAVQASLFADFNGIPEDADRTDFYRHEGKWQNRMILGDSLQVMASLAEREGLRGKVQCIYFDPPYGIKFNSNFQWSTTSRDVKDGNAAHITREPEQVKAFRDTWRDGIHSYLTYLRDRLTTARDLLTESGSIFVQIGDENVHRVRALLDEVFGDENFVSLILFRKTGGLTANFIPTIGDYLLWYARDKSEAKFRRAFKKKSPGSAGATQYRFSLSEDGTLDEIKDLDAAIAKGIDLCAHADLTSQGNQPYDFEYRNRVFRGGFKPSPSNIGRIARAGRLHIAGNSLRYVRKLSDYDVYEVNHLWEDSGISGFADSKLYVVQTSPSVVERCVLLSTDPGDLVLDPTCGSGTTAYVAEQWGRRWITIDTSRVALALARSRLMGARYPYYLLADSKEGQRKEAEVTRTTPRTAKTYGNIRHGFVYERVPHITLKSIANNTEIDVIWERFQDALKSLRTHLNQTLGESWEEWEIPREAAADWNAETKQLHAQWWEQRIARQQEIDASIAAKADYELLYDKPYVDNGIVRVAGPFTVESLSPHRMVAPDTLDSTGHDQSTDPHGSERDFTKMILETLKVAGVQQSTKDDRIRFTSLVPWPGELVCAEGPYLEGDAERRAGVFIGPEFGTVSREDLTAAARETAEAGFDVLIACAFAYDAHATELTKLGRVPVLKARMNADLHMAGELKDTQTANLFVIFGEPDIELRETEDGQLTVEVLGVHVFDPNSGEVRIDGADGVACWFIDTDYDEASFYVRQAYFPGTTNDPYKALKTTLKAEINEEAWETLRSVVSRPFLKPTTGRIAVKVINHLGDEVMKVFRVE